MPPGESDRLDVNERAEGPLYVVGLGNPGREYAGTRHNVGFDVVDTLRGRLDCAEPVLDCDALLTDVQREGRVVVFCKPVTYMNLSGAAIRCLVEGKNASLSELLVVCDDTALPLGQLRLRARGSSGGHNGLQSIIDTLGTEEFPRLRCGIGAPPPGVFYADYVLSPFTERERDEKREMVGRAADAVLSYLSEGLESTMNRFNSPLSETETPVGGTEAHVGNPSTEKNEQVH